MAKMVDWWFPVKTEVITGKLARELSVMPNGQQALLLFVTLLAVTRDTDGRLETVFGDERIAMSDAAIARAVQIFSENQVRQPIQLLERAGMIRRDDGGVLYIVDYSELMRTQSAEAARKADARKRKSTQDNVRTNSGQCPDNVQHIESELESEQNRAEQNRAEQSRAEQIQSSVSQSVSDTRTKLPEGTERYQNKDEQIALLQMTPGQFNRCILGFCIDLIPPLCAVAEKKENPGAWFSATTADIKKQGHEGMSWEELCAKHPGLTYASKKQAARSANPALAYPQRAYTDEDFESMYFDPDRDYSGYNGQTTE